MNKLNFFRQTVFSALILVSASQAIAQVKPYSFDHLPEVKETKFKTDTIRITSFGAKNDGVTLNTKSINDAIAAANKKGGGVVVIPAGLWLTGPVVLLSNVNLHLQKNALLQFTKDFNQYKLVKGDWEGIPQMRNQSPVSANGAENIAITGEGIIDGNGDAWRMVKKDKLTETQWRNSDCGKENVVSLGAVGQRITAEECRCDLSRENARVLCFCKRLFATKSGCA
jgi:polygalacturonase